jgi:hypothetical protein
MQNFLPYSDFHKSASCLDNRRLVKQNLETTQCLAALCSFSQGWRNHPAVKAWVGHIPALIEYGLAINAECIKRGYKDNSAKYQRFSDYCEQNKLIKDYPTWLGNEDFHSSHRSRLLAKGLIDSICSVLKKKLKIKKLDNWTKKYFNKTKNELRFEDSHKLHDLAREQAGPFNINNHYSQFNWTDDPSKPYIWPN